MCGIVGFWDFAQRLRADEAAALRVMTDTLRHRGLLRDWAESLPAEDRLQREGLFNPRPIREKWCEHLSGKRRWSYLLWNVLMFQSWLEAQRVHATQSTQALVNTAHA